MLLPHPTPETDACLDQQPCLGGSPGVLQHVLYQQNLRVARHECPCTERHVAVQIMTVEGWGHGVGPSHAGSPLAAFPDQGHQGDGALQAGQGLHEGASRWQATGRPDSKGNSTHASNAHPDQHHMNMAAWRHASQWVTGMASSTA